MRLTAHIAVMPTAAKAKAAAKPATKPAANPAPAARALKKGDHLFLVDGSGYIFRAYHALPPLTRKSDGLQVNAVLGFCNMLWKLLAEMKDDKPTHLAVVFDKSEKTFRTEMYEAYKAHRPPPPDDLIPQFPLIRDAVHAFEIPCLEQAGYEADDLIATYARLASEAKATTTIVSSDKDLMQLVGNGVTMYDTMKDRRIGAAEVMEKFGVGPDKVIEVQALIGDSSDNVPGVPGIGVKTAAQLIGEYGDLETLLKRASEIKQDKRRQTLIDNAELARISKKLVTLDQNVPLAVPVDELAVHEPDYKHLIAFLKAMEFNTITRRVAEKSGIDASAIEADAKLSSSPTPAVSSSPPPPAGAVAARSAPGGGTGDLFPPPPQPSPASAGGKTGAVQGALTPISLAAARAEKARNARIDRAKYECVRTLERLKHWIARAHEEGIVAVDTETTSLDPMQADLCGFSLAVAPNEACYVPLGHREGGAQGGSDLFAPEAKLCADQIPETQALALLKPLLEDKSVLKIGQNIKFDWLVFAQRGIQIESYDDTMLISYVLDAGKGGHGMDDLAKRWLNHDTIHFQHVAGSGKNQGDVRLRQHREGDRIRCRGRRRDAAAVGCAQAAACRRARHRRLRDAGARHACGARAHGAARHFDRPPSAVTPDQRVRARTGAPRGGDQSARRRAAQSRFAQAARRYPVRQDGPSRRRQNPHRAMVDRCARARRPRRAGPRTAAQDPRLARRLQAALDLHRGAAELRQPDDTPRAHLLRARRHLDRAPLLLRAEFAEHPDPHRGRAQDPPRLRRGARQ